MNSLIEHLGMLPLIHKCIEFFEQNWANVYYVLFQQLLLVEITCPLHVVHWLLLIFKHYVHNIPIGLGKIHHKPIEIQLQHTLEFHVLNH